MLDRLRRLIGLLRRWVSDPADLEVDVDESLGQLLLASHSLVLLDLVTTVVDVIVQNQLSFACRQEP